MCHNNNNNNNNNNNYDRADTTAPFTYHTLQIQVAKLIKQFRFQFSVFFSISVHKVSWSKIIFKETKRPSKDMQVTIARQLGLDPSTVSNFFMNARRRSVDKWREDSPPPDQSSDLTSVRTVLVGGGAVSVQTSSDCDQLSPGSLDLWHNLSVTGGSSGDNDTVPSHTVFIIPRHSLTHTPDSPDPVIEDINEEIVETDEEVLDDDDDCLDDPPDWTFMQNSFQESQFTLKAFFFVGTKFVNIYPSFSLQWQLVTNQKQKKLFIPR